MKWYKNPIVGFSDEDFTKLRKSCLAILKGQPWNWLYNLTDAHLAQVALLYMLSLVVIPACPTAEPRSPCRGGPQE